MKGHQKNILVMQQYKSNTNKKIYTNCYIIDHLFINIDIDQMQLSKIVCKYSPNSSIKRISIQGVDPVDGIVKTLENHTIPIGMILTVSTDTKFYDIDKKRIIQKIFYPNAQTLKVQPKHSLMDIVLQILNHRRSFQTKQSIYQKYIKKARSQFSQTLFKFILCIFFIICVFQFIVYKVFIRLFKIINYCLKFTGYIPLLSVQNQLIFKTNLVRHNLQIHLKQLHNTHDYYSMLNSYFQVTNIISYFLLDSMLGLVSIIITYKYIKYLFQLLKYVTVTLNLAFINQRIWILNFKEYFNFNQIFTEFIESFFTAFIEWFNQFSQVNYSSWLLNFLYVSSYLGLSFQLLLVLELAMIASIHIVILYKLNAKLYQYSIIYLKKLSQIVTLTRINNLTVPINEKYMRPSIKILGLQCLFILLCTLPTIVINYIWLVSIIMICKVALNILHNVVIIFNKFPLLTIIESIKKPMIYPCYPISEPQNSSTRVRIRPHTLKVFELIIIFIEKTIAHCKQIISINMIRNVFQGKDVMTQENLLQQFQSQKIQIIHTFLNLMKI